MLKNTLLSILLLAAGLAITPQFSLAQEPGNSRIEQMSEKPSTVKVIPSSEPLPVEIIVDPSNAKRAQMRDERSEKREIDDLRAQQEAAAAASGSARASDGQLESSHLINRHSRERGNPGFPHAIVLKVWFPAFAGMTDKGLEIEFV